jgi:hypothetical protein
MFKYESDEERIYRNVAIVLVFLLGCVFVLPNIHCNKDEFGESAGCARMSSGMSSFDDCMSTQSQKVRDQHGWPY